MNLRNLILCVGMLVTGCAGITRPVGAVDPAAIAQEISRQSAEVVTFRSKFYDAAVMKALAPSLKRQMIEFRSEIDAYRESAAKRKIADPDLLSIPNDLILLRTVVPNAESIVDTQTGASKATVLLKETVLDDGKVYKSYQSVIILEFTHLEDSWFLNDVIFNRQGTPFRLTDYYEKRLNYFRSQMQR